MALPHILNSRAGSKHHEAFTTNLFRVTLIPPRGVVSDPVMTEQVVSCTGFKLAGPEAIQQGFQTSKRNYASSDVDITQTIAIDFELNIDEAYALYVMNTIVAWRNKVYDPLTGAKGLKKDYIGQIIIENYSRDGQIFWTRTLQNVWPSGELSGGAFDVDYGTADAQRLSTTWTADYYTESRV